MKLVYLIICFSSVQSYSISYRNYNDYDTQQRFIRSPTPAIWTDTPNLNDQQHQSTYYNMKTNPQQQEQQLTYALTPSTTNRYNLRSHWNKNKAMHYRLSDFPKKTQDPVTYYNNPAQYYRSQRNLKKSKCRTWTSPEGIRYTLSNFSPFDFHVNPINDYEEVGDTNCEPEVAKSNYFSPPYYSPGTASDYVSI